MSIKKFGLLMLMVVAIAALTVACGGGGGGGGGGGDVNVTINATDFKFDPNTINAAPGQNVVVTHKNNGQTRHTFVLKDANVNIGADPGQSANATFKAPAAAGSYQFICDVPGHADQGMTGTLVVK